MDAQGSATHLDSRRLLDSIADAIVAADERNRIVYTNAAVERLLGWAPDDLVGKPITTLMPGRLHDSHLEGFARYLATGTPRLIGRAVRVPALRRDGAEVEVELTLASISDAGGRLFVGSLRAVGEVARLERLVAQQQTTLSQTRETLGLLVEQVKDYAIFMLDPEGRVSTWNVGAERLKGYRADEIIGRHFSVFYPEEKVRAGWPAQELTLAARDGRFEDEGSRVRKDGSTFLANVVITALRDGKGDLQGFAKVTRDVTERFTSAEKQLAKREAELRLVTDSVPSLIAFLTPDHRYRFVNRAYEAWFGLGRERFVGREIRGVLGEKVYEAIRPYIERALRGESVTYEAQIPYRDGTRWIEATYTPDRDVRGDVTGIVALEHDVDDRKRTQEALRAAVQARDVFLSIAGHELRTPLTPLALQLQSIERLHEKAGSGEFPAKKVMEKVRKASHQVAHLERLVTRLLDVSRLGEDRLELDLESVELTALVKEAVDRMRAEIEAAGCDLRVKVSRPITGSWDRLRLEQVVTNLLGNASKYGRAKPIEVEVDECGEQGMIAVRDHGIGISAEDQERIFGRFERAVSENHYGGFGLGLWISRMVVEAMGGKIEVESTLGEGSTFRVLLPTKRDRPSERP